MTLRKTVALFCSIAVAAITYPAFAAHEYYNVSNVPFATISNGPQNAVIVDVANPASALDIDAAVRRLTGTTSRSQGSPMSRQLAMLRKAKLIRNDANAAIYPTILIRSNRTTRAASRAESVGGGSITFDYQGWEDADKSLLQQFASLAYPVVQQIYGDPSKTMTVKVINDTGQIDKDVLLGGLYVTGEGVQPEIRLYRYGSNISLERSFLHMMVRAFHDTNSFDYDAWEEGFTRAATVVAGESIDRLIIQQHPAGLETMDFTGKTLGGGDAFYYSMTNYELLNQPPLSNNTFYTSWADTLQGGSGLGGGMVIPRLGMVSTCWLKVYTERARTDGQSFFKLFNERYYTELSGGNDVTGNIPALKDIASSITANVEGQRFEDWYVKQFILDTSTSIGRKLYPYSLPPSVPSNADSEGYSLPVILLYYNTSANGDETPLSGTVNPVYWDYSYTKDLYLSPQYESVQIENGEGDLSPVFFVETFGGNQRVAIDFTVGAETARVYLPAGMTGSYGAENNFMGCIIGAESGSVSAKVDSEVIGTSTQVVRGAFGAGLASMLDFSRVTLTYTPPTGGDPVSRVVNVGPGSYIALLSTSSVPTAMFHTFEAGTRMISIPVTPYAQNQADALKDPFGNPVLGDDKLLLARWNPDLAGDYKYEMYPKTPPFAPGRAYWARFDNNLNVTVTGIAPDPASDWRVGLAQGWNQIGGPFESGVPIANIYVEKGTDDPVAFSEAWAAGWVGKVVWKYVPGTGYVEATSLDPWEGYWIKCNLPEGVVLLVPGPQSSGRSRSVPASSGGSSKAKVDSKDSWALRISACGSNGDANCVTLGVAPGATDGYDSGFDAELPPSYGKAASIAATASGRSISALGVDTRSSGGVKTTWNVVVQPTDPNEDVVLRWKDLSSVPKRCRLTIVDQSTGRSQYLKTSSSYRFNTGDGSARRFTVIADSSPAARLMITGITSGQTRGGTVSFGYTLTTDAQVMAEIVGAGGKRVRSLGSGQPTRSGINSLMWDKRDDAGHVVPTGMYMLQLTAATEDGEMVKNIRPVLIAR